MGILDPDFLGTNIGTPLMVRSAPFCLSLPMLGRVSRSANPHPELGFRDLLITSIVPRRSKGGIFCSAGRRGYDAAVRRVNRLNPCSA